MSLSVATDRVVRRVVQGLIRYVPPQGRGLRIASFVDRFAPPEPGRLFRTRVPGGAHISVDVADRIQACIFYRGVYEPEVTETLLDELRDGDVFLDVGANVGYFALVASSRCGPAGRVHAFEADAVLANRLANDATRLRNRFAPITVHNVGVLDRKGSFALADAAGARGELGERYLQATDSSADAIRTVAIDELLPDLRFDVAKIDVEGAELRAIEGATRAVTRSSPRLLLVEAIDDNLARFGSSLGKLVGHMATIGYDATEVSSRYFAPMLAFRPRRGGLG